LPLTRRRTASQRRTPSCGGISNNESLPDNLAPHKKVIYDIYANGYLPGGIGQQARIVSALNAGCYARLLRLWVMPRILCWGARFWPRNPMMWAGAKARFFESTDGNCYPMWAMYKKDQAAEEDETRSRFTTGEQSRGGSQTRCASMKTTVKQSHVTSPGMSMPFFLAAWKRVSSPRSSSSVTTASDSPFLTGVLFCWIIRKASDIVCGPASEKENRIGGLLEYSLVSTSEIEETSVEITLASIGN